MIFSIPKKHGSALFDIIQDTADKGKQALVFVNTKKSAEKVAEDLSLSLNLKISQKRKSELLRLSKKALHALDTPTAQCERLSRCISKGVSFHHAGLVSAQRNLIEDNFRSGQLSFIIATPTLAAGVDLPAYRVIIRDLKRFSRGRMVHMPVMEYKQQAGRAGRPKYDKEGQSLVIVSTEGEKDKITKRYIYGSPEEIYSKLAVEPVLRSSVLSLVAGNFFFSKPALLDFFSRTFWAHQFQDMGRIAYFIDNTLNELEEWGFVKQNENDKLSATPLGKRVSELYLDPYTAHTFVEALKKIEKGKELNKDNCSVISLISSSLELRPLPGVYAREIEAVSMLIGENYEDFLFDVPTEFDMEYEDFLKSVKFSQIVAEWLSESGEEALYEKYSLRPGELRQKLEIFDWLLYSFSEISRICRVKQVANLVHRLRIRLKYGAREELIPLLQVKNIGKVRARALYSAGIRNIGDVKRAGMPKLSSLIGSRTAERVLAELGVIKSPKNLETQDNYDEQDFIPEQKKGQKGLNSFLN
jgi:helicase